MSLCWAQIILSHPVTAVTRNDLGDVYYNKGSYDDALTKYKEVLQTRESILGEEHPDTITSRNNVIQVVLEMERMNKFESSRNNLMTRD